MLWPALQDPDPVVIFEHAQLYNLEGELADPPPAVDIEHAAVRRAGRDADDRHLRRQPAARRWRRRTRSQGRASRPKSIDLRVLRPLDWRHDHGLGAPDAPRAGGRRRLAHVQPRGRDHRAHRRAGVLRPRCAAGARVQRRGADAVSRSTWKTPRCRCRRRSSRRRWRCAGGPHDRLRLPSLGADMDEGTLLEWHVRPGDAVRKGDVIAVVDTDQGGDRRRVLARRHRRTSCSSSRAPTIPVGTVDGRSCAQPAKRRNRRRSAESARCGRGGRSGGRGRRRPRPRPPRAGAARGRHGGRASRRRRASGPRNSASTSTAVAGPGPAARSRSTDVEAAAAPPAPRRRCRPRRSDAPGDRRGDGPFQARDSALLPGGGHPARARHGAGSRSATPAASVTERAAARGAAAEGRGARAAALSASSTASSATVRSCRAPASTSAWRSRCAAAASWRRRCTTCRRAWTSPR